MCTAPAKRQPPASGAHVRRNFARRLCDCACQQEREPLCVLRLPSKGSRGPAASTLAMVALRGVVYWRARGAAAPLDALCTALATPKAPVAPAAPTPAAAPPGRFCALRVPRERQRDAHAHRSTPKDSVYCVLWRSSSGCGRCTASATPKAALAAVTHTRAAAPQETLFVEKRLGLTPWNGLRN